MIEVADSSLQYDRETKMSLYAAAGVAAAWVLDVEHRALEVHREPEPDLPAGAAGGVRGLPAFPDVVLRMADLLPICGHY